MTTAADAIEPTLADEVQGRRAGIVTRGIAIGIDMPIVLLGSPAIMWGIGVAIGIMHFEQPQYPDFPNWVEAAITLIWGVNYFALTWAFVGRTFGQAVLGLRVVGRRKRRIGYFKALLRTCVMYGTAFVIGPVWLLCSRKRLAIHDLAARTQVIYEHASRKAELDLTLGARDNLHAPEPADA